MNDSGQGYTEYVVILAVMFGLGLAVTSVFLSGQELKDVYTSFYNYYASLANFLNLPFF